MDNDMATPSPPSADRAGARRPTTVEWPTLLIAVAIHAGWLALTWWHAAVPVLVLVVAGGSLLAWHGSLQHEVIHGHPTPWRRVNDAIGMVPLSLWIPYPIYRRSHLAHHASPAITHPAADPESRYVAQRDSIGHRLARLQSTLAGRLLFGPPIALLALAREEAARARHDPAAVARDWLLHLVALLPVVVWLEWTGIGIVRYTLLMVYPGAALTLLRSFAEHRADLTSPGRAASVERGGAIGLLFLNNHLHAAHHDRPDLAWYRLPAHHRRHRARLAPQPTGHYRSYAQIVRRFAFRANDAVLHPSSR